MKDIYFLNSSWFNLKIQSGKLQPKDDVMLLREVLARNPFKIGQLGTKLQQSFPL
jgi:hypothetical protein